MKTGRWSEEEDTILLNYINNKGFDRSWRCLANNAGLRRSGRSCRSRWLNYLRPGLKHGNFTKEEDEKLVTLYPALGSSWSKIAAHLPGRTDLAVKNYWNSKYRKLTPKRKLIYNAPYNIGLIETPEASSTSGTSINNSAEASALITQDDEYMEYVWELICPSNNRMVTWTEAEKLASDLAPKPWRQPLPDFFEIMNGSYGSPSQDF